MPYYVDNVIIYIFEQTADKTSDRNVVEKNLLTMEKKYTIKLLEHFEWIYIDHSL